MISSTDVSIVIPSYNSRKTITACLDSILNQDALPLEVIVVDSSADDTPKIIRQRYPSVKLHHMQSRTFPGPARNIGAKMARGEVVAFIDSDCIASLDWVRLIAARHADGHMIVGGAVEVGNPNSILAWAGHLGEFRDFLPFGVPRHIWHIPTCNISYRIEIFSKYGGFPNAYYPQEDLLFNYLLGKFGYLIWFDPQICIHHFCREDLRGYLSHQHRLGRVTRVTLSKIDLEGSSIARRAWLAWLASPLVGAMKFLRTMKMLIKTYPLDVIRRPALSFVLLLGSVWWLRGFAAGASTGLSGIRGWTEPEEPIFAILRTLQITPTEPVQVDKVA
jgi:glycosyltransferase involved in cell wall biosynthesis